MSIKPGIQGLRAWLCVVGILLGTGPAAAHFSFYSGPLTTPADGAVTAAPLGVTQYRTTSGDIFMGNLDGLVKVARRYVEKTNEPLWRLKLADELAYRAQITGHMDDTVAALGEVRQALAANPALPGGWLLSARLRQTLHDFAGAEADLAQAQAHGAAAAALADLQLSIDYALGRDVFAALQERAKRDPGLYSYADLADAYLERGDFATADRLLTEAEKLYTDVNPLPLAWLHVQHGLACLRYGAVVRAHAYFAAAHERLPQYSMAAEHLALTKAVLGRADEALVLLLYAEDQQTNNPGFYGALAFVEEKLGDTAAAVAADQRAQALYDELVERYQEAWWQHAAEYHLERGDSARALELARKNSELRQTVASLLLLARAELQAGHPDAACTAWNRTLATGRKPPEVTRFAADFAQCPRA